MSERRFPWRTALFVSLGVNLLLVGGAVGAYTAGARFQRPAPPPAAVEVAPAAPVAGQRMLLAAMPPEVRTRLREEMVQGAAETRALRENALQARRNAYAAAAHEPYDSAQVKAAFARMREADEAVVGVFHNRVADAFATMTPQERQSALETLRTASPREHFQHRREERIRDRRERIQELRELPPAERREEIRRRWRERREQMQSGGG